MTNLYNKIITAIKFYDEMTLCEYFRDKEMVNGVDDYIGRRWLISAIDTGNYESVKFLVDRGADVNFIDDEGYSPIHSMIGHGYGCRDVILRLLLSSGADINIRGLDSRTPLHFAVYEMDYEMIEILIRMGADIHIKLNMWGESESPIEAAMSIGDGKMIHLFNNLA